MFNILLFIVCVFIIIVVSLLLSKGATIFDLLTFSNFNSINQKINNDLMESLYEANNNDLIFTIAPSNNFIYKTGEESVEFQPTLNKIIIKKQDKEKISLDINKDMGRLIPIFVSFKRDFNYKPFEL